MATPSPTSSDIKDYLWVFGIIAAILVAFFEALGENLIKLSFTRNSNEDIPLCCRPLWVLGILCITLFVVSFTLIAFALADAVFILARFMNHEQFKAISVGFSLLIMIGVTVVAAAANHSTVVWTTQELEELFTQLPFIISSAILIVLIVVLILIASLAKSYKARVVAAGLLCGLNASLAQLFAKILSELFSEMISEDFNADEFKTSPLPYIVPVLCGVFGLLQIILLNRLLYLYDAFIVGPMITATVITIGTAYAEIFFQEYQRWSIASMILVPIGTIIAMLGVILLAWSHEMNTKKREQSSESFDKIEIQALKTDDSEKTRTAVELS